MPANTAVEKHPVTIIGAGWAGLASAIKLSKFGYPVTLIESARQLGGRARSIPFNQHTVDNGQHLLIGAYQAILNLLTDLGIEEQQALVRKSMVLSVNDLNNQRSLCISAPKLPAPLHLLFALLKAKGLGPQDRLSALFFGSALLFRRIKLTQDMSVTQLLKKYKQTDKLLAFFWEPLCIATLNTPINESSAEVFIRVLQDAFFKHRQDADLLTPRHDLGKLLPEPAMDFIEARQGQIKLGQRVTRLKIESNQIKGYFIGEEYYPCSQLILAVAPQSLAPLLEQQLALKHLSHSISQFRYEPVTTVYLQYPESVCLEQPMQGFIHGYSQWIFDRRICGQPGLMAIVISSRGTHMQMDKNDLAAAVQNELGQYFPDWPQALDYQVIREKRATFSCHVDINKLRPDNQSGVNGLWLAGDYTQTGYPATLEGAVRSGLQCAEQIIHETYM